VIEDAGLDLGATPIAGEQPGACRDGRLDPPLDLDRCGLVDQFPTGVNANSAIFS